MRVTAPGDLRSKPDVNEMLSAFNDRQLSLFILPTEKCNFRCTYCYERYDIGRMSSRTSNGIKALINQRIADLRTLNIEWFGGEPLLAKPVVLDISRHIAGTAARTPGVSYSGSMTTNGYLLDYQTAVELAEVGVRSYQISIDGPPDIHDVTRARADGSGTFARIWENLRAIKDSDLSVAVILRVHFSPATAPTLAPLIDLLNDEFGHDSRFTVMFKAIARLGGPNDAAIPLFGPDVEIRTQRELESRLRFAHQASPPPVQQAGICYAAKPNSFVIRADGRIGKCTVALYDDTNTVGTLTDDGKINIDNQKLRPWMRGFETLDLAELGCPLSGMRKG
jgi:uncharacterized protein